MQIDAKLIKTGAGNGGLSELNTIKKKDLKEGKDLESIAKNNVEWKLFTEMTKACYSTDEDFLSIVIFFLSLPSHCFSINVHPQRQGTTLLTEIIIPWLVGSIKLSSGMPKKLCVWQQLTAKIIAAFYYCLLFLHNQN